MSALFLNNNDDSFSIHPVVVFSILDSFKRRDSEQNRVFGALLGTRNGNKVSIEECFVMPHSEDEENLQVEINTDHVEKMFSLYQQVDTKLVVLGWYATSTNINYVSTLINNVLTEKFGCVNPLLVTVDPSLENNRLNISAYTSTVVCVDGKPFHARFDRVNLETKPFEAEKIAIDTIMHGNTDENDESLDAASFLPKDSDALNTSMSEFNEQLDKIGAYLDGVITGKIPGDAVAGREVATALAAIPTLDKDTFDKMFASNLQDMLLIGHLATIARTQVALADRLNSASNQ